jgi:hypothetical protein
MPVDGGPVRGLASWAGIADGLPDGVAVLAGHLADLGGRQPSAGGVAGGAGTSRPFACAQRRSS